eukprot:m51a1_g9501 hypothetical protein (200) ;mRNA; f:667407-668236
MADRETGAARAFSKRVAAQDLRLEAIAPKRARRGVPTLIELASNRVIDSLDQHLARLAFLPPELRGRVLKSCTSKQLDVVERVAEKHGIQLDSEALWEVVCKREACARGEGCKSWRAAWIESQRSHKAIRVMLRSKQVDESKRHREVKVLSATEGAHRQASATAVRRAASSGWGSSRAPSAASKPGVGPLMKQVFKMKH